MVTRGIWHEMLCCMWDAPERGVLTGSFARLCRLLGATEDELSHAISEIACLQIGDILREGEDYQIINRRMVREERERHGRRKRDERYQEKKREGKNSDAVSTDFRCSFDALSTPPSSSSSSSSKQDLIQNKFVDIPQSAKTPATPEFSPRPPSQEEDLTENKTRIKRELNAQKTVPKGDLNAQKTVPSSSLDAGRSLKISSPQDLIDLWNQELGDILGRAIKLTAERQKKIRLRFEENPSLDYWKQVFGKVRASEWLTGSNPKSNGWKADFDWAIKNDSNHVRIFEGRYNNIENPGIPIAGKVCPKGWDALRRLRKEEGRE